MNRLSINRYKYFTVLVFSLVLLSACATTAVPEIKFEDRVMGRWNAILTGDLAGAYEYLSPGYRSSVSSLDYQRSILQKRVQWKNAEYIESNCTETTCKAKIYLDYVLYGALPGVKSFEGRQAIQESWVLTDGNWYLVPKN
jgi:hypothetical protein